MRVIGVFICGVLAAGGLVGCTGSDPSELVIAAAETAAESHGTFEATFSFEIPQTDGSDVEEAFADLLPTGITYHGAWSGDSIWMEMPDPRDYLADADSDSIDAELPDISGFPTPTGTLVRDGETYMSYDLDGTTRWVNDLPADAALGTEGSAYGKADPAGVLDEIRRAAEDPSALEVVSEGTYQVSLSPTFFMGTDTSDTDEWRTDPETVEGYDEDPEAVTERVRRIDDRMLAETTHDATFVIGEHGLEKVRVEFGLLNEDYTDCELIGELGIMTTSISYSYTEEKPAIPEPSAEEMVSFEDFMDEAFTAVDIGDAFGDIGDAFGDLADLGEPGVLDSTFQTAAGERYRNEVLWTLIDWATEAGIDWTTIPPFEDQQLIDTYNAFFEQKSQAEGGAIATDDGLWLPSEIRKALVGQGDREQGEVDAMSREELAAAFNELYAELGGRGHVGPGTDTVPNVYAMNHMADQELGGLDEPALDDENIDELVIDDYPYSLDGCPA